MRIVHPSLRLFFGFKYCPMNQAMNRLWSGTERFEDKSKDVGDWFWLGGECCRRNLLIGNLIFWPMIWPLLSSTSSFICQRPHCRHELRGEGGIFFTTKSIWRRIYSCDRICRKLLFYYIFEFSGFGYPIFSVKLSDITSVI